MTIFNDSQLPVAMVIDYNVKGQFLLFCKVSTPDASCDQWHTFSFQKQPFSFIFLDFWARFYCFNLVMFMMSVASAKGLAMVILTQIASCQLPLLKCKGSFSFEYFQLDA